jgi:hypothetical protein
MAYIRGVRVAHNVGGPFEFCGVGVAGPHVPGLKGFEVLLGAEFVCHFGWLGDSRSLVCLRVVGLDFGRWKVEILELFRFKLSLSLYVP